MTRSDLGQIVSACAVATSLILGACGPGNRPRQLVSTGGKTPDSKLTDGGLVTNQACMSGIGAVLKDYSAKLAAPNSPSKALLDQIKGIVVNVGDDGQPATITLNGQVKGMVSFSGGAVDSLKVSVQKAAQLKGIDAKDATCETSYLITVSSGEGAQAGTVYAVVSVLGASVTVSDLRCEGGTDKRSDLESLAKTLADSKSGKNSLILTSLVGATGNKSQGVSAGGAGLKMSFVQNPVAKAGDRAVDPESMVAQSGNLEIFATTAGLAQTKEKIEFKMQLDLTKGVQAEVKQLWVAVSATPDGKPGAAGISFNGSQTCEPKKDEKKDDSEKNEDKSTGTSRPDGSPKAGAQVTPGATPKVETEARQTDPVQKPGQQPPVAPPAAVVKGQGKPAAVPPAPAPVSAPRVGTPGPVVENQTVRQIQGLAYAMVAMHDIFVKSEQAVKSASDRKVVAVRALDEDDSNPELVQNREQAEKALNEATATRNANLKALREGNSKLRAKVDECNKDSACAQKLQQAQAQNNSSIQKALDLKF